MDKKGKWKRWGDIAFYDHIEDGNEVSRKTVRKAQKILGQYASLSPDKRLALVGFYNHANVKLNEEQTDIFSKFVQNFFEESCQGIFVPREVFNAYAALQLAR